MYGQPHGWVSHRLRQKADHLLFYPMHVFNRSIRIDFERSLHVQQGDFRMKASRKAQSKAGKVSTTVGKVDGDKNP